MEADKKLYRWDIQGELAGAMIEAADARSDATAVCEHAATLQVNIFGVHRSTVPI